MLGCFIELPLVNVVHINKKIVFGFAFTALASLLLCTESKAQSTPWPNKQIRFIVPFAQAVPMI